jgi:hypothetical protein
MDSTKKNAVDAVDALHAILLEIFDQGNAEDRSEAVQCCAGFLSACTSGTGNGFMVLPSSEGEGN